VLLFAGSCCREAYIRGSLSTQTNNREKATPQTRTARPAKSTKWSQTETTAHPVHQEPITPEQIREYPIGTEIDGTSIYEQEYQT